MDKQTLRTLVFRLLELDRSVETIYTQKKFLNYVHSYSAIVPVSHAQGILDAEAYKINSQFQEVRNTLMDYFNS
jgi:hypothetical protein